MCHHVAGTFLAVEGNPVAYDVLKNIVHHRIPPGIPHPNDGVGIPCRHLGMPQLLKPATGHHATFAPLHRHGAPRILEIPEREAFQPDVSHSGEVEHRAVATG